MDDNNFPAVLFLVFNRPDTTKRVFREIQSIKPPRLYVACDGPRLNNEEDEDRIRKVKEIVSDVDWDCKVKTLFRDSNLGCKVGVSKAIDWFFKFEEEGIILEDDCVPDPSFFTFCKRMLSEYRNDTRVMMVSGTNYLFESDKCSNDYYFSRYFAIWGWATWRRAWEKYDAEMECWPKIHDSGYLETLFGAGQVAEHFTKMFNDMVRKKIDTWDIPWVFTCLINHGLSIVSSRNLISNIGFEGVRASKEDGISKFHDMPRKEIDINTLGKKKNVYPDPEMDMLCFENIGMLEKKPGFAMNYIRRIIKRFF